MNERIRSATAVAAILLLSSAPAHAAGKCSHSPLDIYDNVGMYSTRGQFKTGKVRSAVSITELRAVGNGNLIGWDYLDDRGFQNIILSRDADARTFEWYGVNKTGAATVGPFVAKKQVPDWAKLTTCGAS